AHQIPVRAVDEDFEEPAAFDEVTEAEGDLKRRIDEAGTINAVTDLMLDGATQAVLATMPPGTRDEVRDYAKARLVALGWPERAGMERSGLRGEVPARAVQHEGREQAHRCAAAPGRGDQHPDRRGFTAGVDRPDRQPAIAALEGIEAGRQRLGPVYQPEPAA